MRQTAATEALTDRCHYGSSQWLGQGSCDAAGWVLGFAGLCCCTAGLLVGFLGIVFAGLLGSVRVVRFLGALLGLLGLFDCWVPLLLLGICLGLLGHWVVGLLGCWVLLVLLGERFVVGLGGSWVVGLLLLFAVGLSLGLGLRVQGELLGCWAVGLLGCWLGSWVLFLLGCWALSGLFDFWVPLLLGFRLLL